MPEFTRSDIEARYRLFDFFALEDQRHYYQAVLARYRKALSQVNRLTTQFSFLASVAAAAVGLLVQAYYTNSGVCAVYDAVRMNVLVGTVSLSDTAFVLYEENAALCLNMQSIVAILMVVSVMMPVLAAFFNTLSNLYQWERMTTIYGVALENIEVADAQSPLPEMDDLVYKASVRAVVEGTLRVMDDESAQWGQSIRAPVPLEKFVEEERRKAAMRAEYSSSDSAG